ncbi:hypothetical protein [Salmonella phage vB_SalM_ABTNLsp5]|nr:hypothetical protein [Salmonella phage vB_SalM_ABTNLsp5]
MKNISEILDEMVVSANRITEIVNELKAKAAAMKPNK